MIRNLFILAGVVAIAAIHLLLPTTAQFLPYTIAQAVVVLWLLQQLFFQYLDLGLIYKKARETATGAGMVFISMSVLIAAILNFLK